MYFDSTFSESEIREAVNSCKRSIYSDITDVAEVTRLLIGLTTRAAHVAKTTIEKNDDVVFRNGVMVHVNQLNKGSVGFIKDIEISNWCFGFSVSLVAISG